MIEQTAGQVGRHLAAMGCGRYDVFIRGKDEKDSEKHTWTASQIERAVPQLLRENALGRDICIRPAGKHNLVLVSAVDPDILAAMDRDGLNAAVTVRTGPHRRHAWIKLSEGDRPPLSEAEKSTITGKLIQTYGLSPGQASMEFYGHLAGFSTPHHKVEGKTPICAIDRSDGRTAAKAPALIRQAGWLLAREREKTHFNISVELGGREFSRTIRIEGMEDPASRRRLLEKEARAFLIDTAFRHGVDVERAGNPTITEATPEQVRAFERRMERSMDRGPGLGM